MLIIHHNQQTLAGAMEAQVHGMEALAQLLFWTWVLDLVYEAPSPSFCEENSPFEESLYFSETLIDPAISKVLLATSQFWLPLDPAEADSLTLAWLVTVCLSGMTMF